MSLNYQTYDVTGLVSQGTNAFGAILADGWYAGYLGSLDQGATILLSEISYI